MRRRIPPSRGARTVIATTGIARAAARIAARARVRVRIISASCEYKERATSD